MIDKCTIYRQKRRFRKSRYGPMMTTSQPDQKFKNLMLKMKLTIDYIASDKCAKYCWWFYYKKGDKNY